MADDLIRFYLLRKQPQIYVNGVQQTFSPQILMLLIYLAETSEAEYTREELIRLVYGTDTARETFRKVLVYSIRKLIPDVSLETPRHNVLRFARDRIWVDSRVFAERANDLLYTNPVFNKKHYLEAKEILDLYQEPFLLEFHPKSSESGDNTRFLSWQKSRQRDLNMYYQRLLDQMILFGLRQERYWAEAQRYAEQWMRGLSPSTKPLQYLIWLGSRQFTDTLDTHLAELRSREEAGEQPIGPTWSEWNDARNRGILIPLARLLPQNDQANEDQETAWVGGQIDRKETFEQILTFLTTPQKQMFAVVGLPGVGKTEIAQTAAQLLPKRMSNCKIVMLDLTPQLDLELLCNNVLDQLGRQDLLALDYAQKRRRLKQLLQAPNLVVIVDEGHTTHFAHLDALNEVLTILSDAQIMIVARELPRFDHYVIELPGLDDQQGRAFLVAQVPWLKEIDGTVLEEIAHLTGGLPLLLHIIVGGLKKDLGRLHSLIEYLKAHHISPQTDQDVYLVYESILAWLWQYLGAKDKDLLYAVSLFAPEEGTNSEELAAVLTNVIPQEGIRSKLNHLVDLHLIERKHAFAARERFILHPIILDFVRKRTQHPRRPHAPMIEQAYIRYLLEFVGEYLNEAERLDEHKLNILRVFDLIFFDDNHVWARPSAVEALNRLFPYFEMRGLHSAASKLIARVLELAEFESVTTHIQMLRHAAKIASIQAKDAPALNFYQEALAVAQKANLIQQYASLYHGIGCVHLEKGQFVEAIRNLELAEKWAEASNYPPLLYTIWTNLGVSAFRQGHFDTALQQYQKVLDHLGSDEANLPPELQTIAQFIQTWLGLTYTELGNYDVAVQHFQQSMGLARRLNYPQLIGYLYLNMGITYCYQKEYDNAADCFVQSGMIADQIQHAALRAQVTLNQGMLASTRFEHEKALYLHRTALIEAEEQQLTWMKVQIFLSLGKTYLRDEQFESAIKFFAEVLLHEFALAYVAQALYGMALSIMLKAHFIGDNHVETTSNLVHPFLTTRLGSSSQFAEAKDYLDWAHAAFQRDLDHLPRLDRYHIVETLRIWLSKTDQT